MNIMNKVTLRTLKKNKTRTIVTIIGVILSAAMITAVTTFASSIQNLLLDYAISGTGDWHAKIDITTTEYLDNIINDNRFSKVSIAKGGGYALLDNVSVERNGNKTDLGLGVNEYKPYLYVMELDNNAMDILPIHLSEGRLAKNANEVVIPNHISYNGGVEYKLGDSISLEIGNRTIDGHNLNQNNPFNHEQDGKAEDFKESGSSSRTFSIVGFYERYPYEIEEFSAPGYSILTLLDESSLGLAYENFDASIYVNMKNPRKVFDIDKEFHNKYQVYSIDFNNTVLMYEGASLVSGFNIVLYGLIGIVVSLIMIGSIALIYNSFSISISERTKQFGLLSSVGATKKQITNSVLSEALFIAIIGIPIGILSGIIGIGITIHFLENNFASMLGDDFPVSLSLHVSGPSIIAAIILSLITILISAYIPAKRSKKSSTLDAIRQTSDIKLSSKNVKTFKLTRKLFGIEGDLALKNLKRNKKRYRSTVFSLFISILLFISASSVSMYLSDSVENAFQVVNYDLQLHLFDEELNDNHRKAYKKIMDLDTISDGSIQKMFGYAMTHLNKGQVKPDFYSRVLEEGFINGASVNDGDDLPIEVELYSINHDRFISYLDELNLNKETIQNSNQISAIILDKQHYYDDEQELYMNDNIFKDNSEINLVLEKVLPRSQAEIDEILETGEGLESKSVKIPVTVRAFAEKTPPGAPEYASRGRVVMIYDEESLDDFILNSNKFDENDIYKYGYSMFFKSTSPYDSEDEIEKIFDETDLGHTGMYIYNAYDESETIRNVITIINVFAYGFIILMSLITIANVFNTISTNINLRRREFAMLKSVGMTSRGFNKMLNFESIFYGLKALLYGIPASVLVTYLIYQIFKHGVHTDFYLPVRSIIISIFTVFFVVFVSMIYSMRKVKNENIIDALKNENL